MRNTQNVPGRFYVESSCASCYLCMRFAPHTFRRKEGVVYVSKQPDNPQDLEKCLDAYHSCPTSSIIDSEV